jgi:signal peptidase II
MVLFAIVGVVLDQLSKSWVQGINLPAHGMAITSFFNLRLVGNTGVSFSLLDGLSPWALFVVSALIMLFFVLMWVWETQTIGAWAFTLIISGAIGNLIDRGTYGVVRDFLDFHIWGYHWPTFNIADILITGGAGLYVIDILRVGANSRTT